MQGVRVGEQLSAAMLGGVWEAVNTPQRTWERPAMAFASVSSSRLREVMPGPLPVLRVLLKGRVLGLVLSRPGCCCPARRLPLPWRAAGASRLFGGEMSVARHVAAGHSRSLSGCEGSTLQPCWPEWSGRDRTPYTGSDACPRGGGCSPAPSPEPL